MPWPGRHLANDYQAFMRVLRERVVSAAGVVEDGSVEGKSGAPTYTGKRASPCRCATWSTS
jgi:hypothetical protein